MKNENYIIKMINTYVEIDDNGISKEPIRPETYSSSNFVPDNSLISQITEISSDKGPPYMFE